MNVKRMGWLCLALGVLGLSAPGVCPGQTVRTKLVFCRPAAAAPALDGELSEPCWQQASTFDDFGFLRWGDAKGKTADQMPVTRGRLLYDDQNLYFAFECFEPNMEALRASLLRNAPIFAGDCLEIYIDTLNDDKTFVAVWANPRGQSMSERVLDMDWAIVTDYSFRLWARYRYGVKVNDDGWVVEAAIAWKDLGVKPEPGRIMGFNPCRFRFSHAPAQFLCWSTIDSGQKDPSLYGHMVLGEPRDDLSEILQRIYPAFERLTVHVPQGQSIAVYAKGARTVVAYDDMLRGQLTAMEQRLKAAEAELSPSPAGSDARKKLDEARTVFNQAAEEAAKLSVVTESDYLRLAKTLDAVEQALRDSEWANRIQKLFDELRKELA